MSRQARAVSQRLVLWDAIDQGEMGGLMLCSLLVTGPDQNDCQRAKRKVLK